MFIYIDMVYSFEYIKNLDETYFYCVSNYKAGKIEVNDGK